jgi:hypothetical protein
MTKRANQKTAVLVGLLVMTLGCGDSGPTLASVDGLVTVDGKPLPLASLTFVPESGSPSYGQTDKEGKYTLMFTDTKYGAMLGKHEVKIEVTKLSKGEIEEMKAQGMEVSSSDLALPKQYKKPGALTAEIKSGKNKVDFPLTSK